MRKLNNKGEFDIYVVIIIMAIVFVVAICVGWIYNSYSADKAKAKTKDIVDNYVAVIQKDKDFTENERINLKGELLELGYDEVEIDFPTVTGSGEYTLVVIAKTYNLRGGIYSSVDIKKEIYIE